jgi:hypothetical protein
VTRIYLDPTALVLETGDATGADHVAPGASDAVAHLVAAGFDVILLGVGGEGTASGGSTGSTASGGSPGRPLRLLPHEVRHEASLPEHLEPDAWYLTGEPHPSFGRPRGGTTVLVGPRRPAGRLPLPRFDMETRDMASAAMEILTRQAMA